MDDPYAPPQDWIDAIEGGEKDLAAGCTVSAETVLAELRAANKRMMERRARKATDAA
jgi:hypothetical protein